MVASFSASNQVGEMMKKTERKKVKKDNNKTIELPEIKEETTEE